MVEIGSEVERVWDKNCNRFNNLVKWDSLRLHKKRLKELANLLGGVRMEAIVRNYTIDYKFWNHGMPDLIVWNPKSRIIKFSEVKSENDRLSEVQKAWLAYMSNNGIFCEVCLVNWPLPTDK